MRSKSLTRKDGGFVVVLLAAGMVLMLCAIAGLVLDIGRAYVVRGELQNAAESLMV